MSIGRNKLFECVHHFLSDLREYNGQTASHGPTDDRYMVRIQVNAFPHRVFDLRRLSERQSVPEVEALSSWRTSDAASIKPKTSSGAFLISSIFFEPLTMICQRSGAATLNAFP
jgi:hypothetical protein